MDKTTKRLAIGAALLVAAFLIYSGAFFQKHSTPKVEDGVNLGNPAEGLTVTLAGASTNAVSLPRSKVLANSTTTDPVATGDGAVLDGGFTITQSVFTGVADFVWLTGSLKAGSPTSTTYVQLQGAFDSAGPWFDLHASSTPPTLNATTTPIQLSPMGAVFDPGTATTTFAKTFYTGNLPWIRFLMYADDLTTDPTDGVQAFIQATPIKQRP